MIRLSPLAVLLGFTACFGSSNPTQPHATSADDPHPPLQLSAQELRAQTQDVALVPSPIETQQALAASGIDTQLAELIQPRNYRFDTKDPDNVAVRTGVVIADLLLTVKTAPKDHLLAQLNHIQQGLALLNGGKDIDATIIDLKERIRADAVSRDELLKELDELSGAVIPELTFNGVARIVPLISAGSWLEGSNLVAKACKQANRPNAANDLLRQPAVVDYFIRYVNQRDGATAPPAITQKLTESLQRLRQLSVKQDSLTMADMNTVIQVTNDVLALL